MPGDKASKPKAAQPPAVRTAAPAASRSAGPRSASKSPRSSTRPTSLVVPTPTPPGSAPGSRRSSLVLDAPAYRYSLNVGGIARFPTASAGASGSGANQILAHAAQERKAKQPRGEEAIDPARASVSSSTSSRVSSSRYTAEEAAPQRRPVVHTLPSDPAARGPWSKSNSRPEPAPAPPAATGGKMTSFPFPHPVTPRSRRTDGRNALPSPSGGSRWQRLLNALFAGPYERQLLREEAQDDEITHSIIQNIAARSGAASSVVPPNYGAIPKTPVPLPSHAAALSPSSTDDEADPYGYRRLAGPDLLPSYSTDLATRRRERRRARSRARFHCMALWTIWTVAILLILIVAVLLFSFRYPDRLPLPGGSPDPDDDDDDDDPLGLALLVFHRTLLHLT